MTNLATARAADAAGFTDREIREVVVQNELLLAGAAGVGIKFLGVLARAERCQREGLRFSALEDGRTMSPRQQPNLTVNRAHLFEATAIEALVLLHDQAAHSLLLNVIESVLENKRRHLFFAELFDKLLADLVGQRANSGLTGELARCQQSGDDALTSQGFRLVQDFLRNNRRRDRALGFIHLRGEFLLHLNNGLNTLVPELKRSVEIRFGDFLGRTFEHHEVRFVTDVNDVQIAFEHLGMCGVRDELSAYAANSHGANGPGERKVADHQRGGSTDERQHVGVILPVRAQNNALNLNFVVPTFGKQGTNRPINEARGENLFLGGTSFSFEIPAWELAGSRCFFSVIYGEWEEILTFFRFRSTYRRYEDNGFAKLNCYGAIGLFC